MSIGPGDRFIDLGPLDEFHRPRLKLGRLLVESLRHLRPGRLPLVEGRRFRPENQEPAVRPAAVPAPQASPLVPACARTLTAPPMLPGPRCHSGCISQPSPPSSLGRAAVM